MRRLPGQAQSGKKCGRCCPRASRAAAAADLGLLLQHADQRVRLKAQFELVRRADVTTFRVTASRAEHQLARIHSLWGIGQLARRDPQHSALLEAFTSDPDPEIRAQAARMIGDVRDGRLAGALLPLRRGCRAARAVLRGGGARPAGLRAGNSRPGADARRQRRPRRQPAARGEPRAGPHRRCLPDRGALPSRLARRAHRRHRRAAADAPSRRRALPRPIRTSAS